MTIHNQRQGLIMQRGLNEQELAEIRQLAEICDQYEHLRTRLSWKGLAQYAGPENNNFLYYQDNQLVGYLWISTYGGDERELVGMVHPQYRRRGIFSQLLQAAQKEWEQRGVSKIVLICERTSQSGQACIRAIKAQPYFAEYEMELEQFQERFAFDDRLVIQKATPADLDTIVAIMTACYQEPAEHIHPNIEKRLQDPRIQIYLATFGNEAVGCHEPVGVLRLHEEGEHETGIYGFGIIPDYQGRGLGRQMLEEAIRTVQKQHPGNRIMLDVDVTNEKAINLYRSCGFRIVTTYEYYLLP